MSKPIEVALTADTLKVLGLQPTASAGEAASALSALVDKAKKLNEYEARIKEYESEKTAREQAQAQADIAAKKQQVTAMLDAAVTAKQITVEAKAQLEKTHGDKPDELKPLLDTMKPYSPITAQLDNPKSTEDKFAGTYSELDKKGLVAELKRDHPDLYRQKFKEKFGSEPTKA